MWFMTKLRMDKVLLTLMVICAVASANPFQERLVDLLTNIHTPTDSRNLTQYDNLQPVVESFMRRVTRELYPLIEDLLFDPEIPQECGNAFQKILVGLQSFEFWAYRFIRSSGSLPSALDGTSADLGDYDSCLAAEARNVNGDVLFTGRYCTLLLAVDNVFVDKVLRNAISSYSEVSDYLGNNTIATEDLLRLMGNRIGVCVPSTCRGEDIEYAVKKVGGKYGFHPWVPSCRALSEDPPLTGAQIGIIIWVASLAALTVVGIFAERKLKSTEGKKLTPVSKFIHKIFYAFSLTRNLRIVFRTGVAADLKHLSCVHGLRAISAFYILYGHTYLISDPFALGNPLQIFRWLRHDITMVPIYMGFYVVDSFFCIAGMMSYRSVKRELTKERPPPKALVVIVSLIRRWIRLSIPAMFLIAIFIVYPIVLSGPSKDLILDLFIENCKENWWSIPAMVGNFLGVKACLIHLWFIPADFQATAIIVIPVILLIGRKFRLTGTMLLLAIALYSCLFLFFNTMVYELPPTIILLPHFVRKVTYLFFDLYTNSQGHLMSSVIGIFIAHLIDRYMIDNPRKLTRSTLWQIWLSLSTVATINFFIPYYWQTGGDYLNVWTALYAGFSRVIWCSFVGWLVFVCATGYGGIVNKFLSSRAFIPLSRISYSFYLVHVLVMGAKVCHQRNLTEARHYLQAMTTASDFIQSFFFAIIFFCLAEAPTTHIEKMIYVKIYDYFESRLPENTITSKEDPLKTATGSMGIVNYRL